MPALKAGLSNDKEIKSIIDEVSSLGNKQDKMRAYALEKLLNKLDTDDKCALERDEFRLYFSKTLKAMKQWR